MAVASAGLLVGCNSGGGSVAGAKVDTANEKVLVATLFDSIDMSTPQLPPANNIPAASASTLPLPTVLSSFKRLDAVQNGGTQSCSDGGTVSGTKENGTPVINFDDCEESGTTTNGQIAVNYSEQNGSVTYTLTDYTFENAHVKYDTRLTTYTIASGYIAYNTSGDVTVDGKTMQFSKYGYTLDISGKTMKIAVEGMVKTDALGDWMGIKTSKPMALQDNACPSEGSLLVKGAVSDMKVKFEGDGSVGVYFGNRLSKRYSNCNAVPALDTNATS